MAQKESGGMELQELQEEKASGIPQFLWEAPASQGTMGFSFTATAVTERRRWTMRNQQRVEPSRRARLAALKTEHL